MYSPPIDRFHPNSPSTSTITDNLRRLEHPPSLTSGTQSAFCTSAPPRFKSHTDFRVLAELLHDMISDNPRIVCEFLFRDDPKKQNPGDVRQAYCGV
jgi:hypothetical protein